jgi:hypothetical protein
MPPAWHSDRESPVAHAGDHDLFGPVSACRSTLLHVPNSPLHVHAEPGSAPGTPANGARRSALDQLKQLACHVNSRTGTQRPAGYLLPEPGATTAQQNARTWPCAYRSISDDRHRRDVASTCAGPGDAVEHEHEGGHPQPVHPADVRWVSRVSSRRSVPSPRGCPAARLARRRGGWAPASCPPGRYW